MTDRSSSSSSAPNVRNVLVRLLLSKDLGGAIALSAILATLKLNGIISWSWLWVLSPIWIFVSILIGFFLFGIAAIFFVVRMIRNDSLSVRSQTP